MIMGRQFHLDPALPSAEVERLAAERIDKMRAPAHPFFLRSKCDVLRGPGSERDSLGKVGAFRRCAGPV
jgi:hypothetical protein